MQNVSNLSNSPRLDVLKTIQVDVNIHLYFYTYLHAYIKMLNLLFHLSHTYIYSYTHLVYTHMQTQWQRYLTNRHIKATSTSNICAQNNFSTKHWQLIAT